jgi:phosphopantothenoylcysteine decarboxylase
MRTNFMAKVLLGVTGSVAASRTPNLFQELTAAGHLVKVVATSAALYFFEPASLTSSRTTVVESDTRTLVLDKDEWPGKQRGAIYQRGDPVLHIELRRWADLLLIAPLDANTLAKLANGLADNCLTCVWRAWDPGRPVVLAPAMNTMMWDHPMTIRQFRQLALDAGATSLPDKISLLELLARLNEQCRRLYVVPPQSKRLACDDVGMGAMAEVSDLVAAVGGMLERE